LVIHAIQLSTSILILQVLIFVSVYTRKPFSKSSQDILVFGIFTVMNFSKLVHHYYMFFLKVFLKICFIHMWIQCLGHYSPLTPTPSLSPTPLFQAETVLPLSQFCWRESISSNRKDKGFLLVEVRIAIQGDSSHCFHVHMCYILNWFFSNWPFL
jgi:hypothetical protein